MEKFNAMQYCASRTFSTQHLNLCDSCLRGIFVKEAFVSMGDVVYYKEKQ